MKDNEDIYIYIIVMSRGVFLHPYEKIVIYW